jgi:hypothetical protein
MLPPHIQHESCIFHVVHTRRILRPPSPAAHRSVAPSPAPRRALNPLRPGLLLLPPLLLRCSPVAVRSSLAHEDTCVHAAPNRPHRLLLALRPEQRGRLSAQEPGWLQLSQALSRRKSPRPLPDRSHRRGRGRRVRAATRLWTALADRNCRGRRNATARCKSTFDGPIPSTTSPSFPPPRRASSS